MREGNLIRSTCDYVLSDDSRKRFKRVRITNPRHFDSDHYAICFALFSKRPKQHQQYLRQRKAFPLKYDPHNETQADTLLHQFPLRYHQKRQPRYTPTNEHQRQQHPVHLPSTHPIIPQHQPQHLPQDPPRQQPNVHPQPQPTVQHPHQSWVSDFTWRLIDQRASVRRQDNPNDEPILQHLSQQIRKSLRRDRKRRTTKAGEKIQQLLDDNNTRSAWAILRRWYRQVQTKVTKPSPLDMDSIYTTFQQLYKRDTDLPPTNIPVTYTAIPVPDHPPNDFEITLAVQKLRLHKAPGPSGLRTEDVLHWMRDPDQTKWKHLSTIVQHVFITGEIPQRLAFSTLVLLPKPDGGVRGIGLLETIWKIISIIIKDRLVDSNTCDDSLHGFLPTRGTSTAIIEAKLKLDTTIATGTTSFQVFMDLSKAYDSVSREKLLLLLTQYGVGPNIITILTNFWAKLQVAPKQGGFYGRKIQTKRGVTQGDPLSPILFNIVIDAAVRETKRLQGPINGKILFYADDGLISGTDLQTMQQYLNIITELFARVGLKTNASKTKVLVSRPDIYNHWICSPVFNRRFGGNDPSYSEFRKQPVNCPVCNLQLQRVSLPRHMLNKHNIYEVPTRRNSVNTYLQQQPQTYHISMDNETPVDCPVPTCPGIYSKRYSIRLHFQHRHYMDNIIIDEEGPLPKCQLCHLTCSFPNSRRHLNSKPHRDGITRHERRILQQQNELAETSVLTINGTELEHVQQFKYLGRPISTTSNDQVAINYNLQKAKKQWGRIANILRREGAEPKTMGNFYRSVIQSVLLYSSQTWQTNALQLDSIVAFHHKVARFITNKHIRKLNRRSTDTCESILKSQKYTVYLFRYRSTRTT
jgi:Reverse transcriptase (RNA-dependent DNA polymerase)